MGAFLQQRPAAHPAVASLANFSGAQSLDFVHPAAASLADFNGAQLPDAAHVNNMNDACGICQGLDEVSQCIGHATDAAHAEAVTETHMVATRPSIAYRMLSAAWTTLHMRLCSARSSMRSQTAWRQAAAYR